MTSEAAQMLSFPQEQVPLNVPSAVEKPPTKEANPPPEDRSFKAYRIKELPKSTTTKSLREALRLLFTPNGEALQEDIIYKLSVAPDPNDPLCCCIATVSFSKLPKALDKCSENAEVKLSLKIDDKEYDVHVDSHFRGMTALYSHEPMVE